MTTVTRSIRFTTKDRRKRAVVATAAGPDSYPPEPSGSSRAVADANDGRVPRVARLMALAIRFDELLREGVVANQSELAKLARVTQPRMTQIMNLLHLAPDIQEEILLLPGLPCGRVQLSERNLRHVVQERRWAGQRLKWARLRRDIPSERSCHTRTH